MLQEYKEENYEKKSSKKISSDGCGTDGGICGVKRMRRWK